MNEKKKKSQVLLDYEEKMSLENAADFLETIANKLQEEGSFTLTHGEQSHTIQPSEQVVLEVKYEKKRSGKMQLELELEWREGEEGETSSGGLQID